MLITTHAVILAGPNDWVNGLGSSDIELTVRMYGNTSIRASGSRIYLDTEPRQSHHHQSLILKRLRSQHSMTAKRKSFELYENTTTVFTSNMRKQPSNLCVPTSPARSFATILTTPSMVILSTISLFRLSRRLLRPMTLGRLT